MNCELCARKCGINRNNICGACNVTNTLKIANYGLFMCEEPCISYTKGSGAIFFSGCSLKCIYCQNYEISSLANGVEISVQKLADIFKQLQDMGAVNINLVNPTHFVPQIESALKIFKPDIPIVYNTHGYERVEVIERVAKWVDIFLPDFKYFSNASGLRYSGINNYFEVATKAIETMIYLKPDIFTGEAMLQGVLIRHLILPLHSDDSVALLEYIAKNFKGTKVSVMCQFTPYGRCAEFKELNRQINARERNKVINAFLNLELDGYTQDLTSVGTKYIPKWNY